MWEKIKKQYGLPDVTVPTSEKAWIMEHTIYNDLTKDTTLQRVTVYPDKHWMLEQFKGESKSWSAKVIWDGNHSHSLLAGTETIVSYLRPQWYGDVQLKIWVGQYNVVDRNALPEDEALSWPTHLQEVLPSEQVTAHSRWLGEVTVPACVRNGFTEKDSAYLSRQVKNDFVFAKTIEALGQPTTIRYEVWQDGVVVREDWKGGDISTQIFDTIKMKRFVVDAISKSVTSYPLTTREGHMLLELYKTATYANGEKPVETKRTVPVDYTERGPIEAYEAHCEATHQQPENRVRQLLEKLNAEYNALHERQ